MSSKILGALKRYEPFTSRYVPEREVDVWLPPGYEDRQSAYPVIYMHDGRNLFDPALSNTDIDWGVDEAIVHLMEADVTDGAIVVGVWDGENRWGEYMPQKALPLMTPQQAASLPDFFGEPAADNYLRFLVEEVKPFVDQTYRTQPRRAHTFLMGSSMGGLISLYGVCEYTAVFGAAACLSTHWPAGDGVVLQYLESHLPAPSRHRFYFDYGTEGLDAAYEPFQQQADRLFQARGYRPGQDFMSRKFPGAGHAEKFWRDRVYIPLHFLLAG